MNNLKIGLLLLSTFFPSYLRLALWRKLGFQVGVGCNVSPFTVVVADYIEIGPGAVIRPLVFIYAPKKLLIGERSKIFSFVRIVGFGVGVFGPQTVVGLDCFIDVTTEFHLGRRTALGPRGTYFTHGDSLHTCTRYYGRRNGPIIIGTDCWIGMGCIVYPKVTVGDGTVVLPGVTIGSNLPEQKTIVPMKNYRIMSIRIAQLAGGEQVCMAALEEAFHYCADAHPGSSLDCTRSDRWELCIPRRGRVVLLRENSSVGFTEEVEKGSIVIWRLRRYGEISNVPTFEFDELVVSGGWTPFAEHIADFLSTVSVFPFVFEDRILSESDSPLQIDDDSRTRI